MRRDEATATLIWQAALLGVVAGLRSQMPGALLALRRGQAPRRAGWRSWPVLRHRWGRVALIGSAAGEAVADKLPQTPPRTAPGPLLGRIAFGGLAGAALVSGGGTVRLLTGATAGTLGALAGSYGGYHARALIGEKTGLPDPVVAVGEDGLALGLGLAAL